MRVLILGGGGFIGRRLAKELLNKGGLAHGKFTHLTLVDLTFHEDMPQDSRLEYIQADFGDEGVIRNILQHRPDLIYHLAAIVSGEAEKNLDFGMQINLHASLQLLEVCRSLSHNPRIVFASSCAVFGGDTSKVIMDNTAPKPRSSYGTQKAIVELLINDYSRRGFIDGRSLRLPTIAIRPGKPNAATSSFISAIIREPLAGKKAFYPVPLETEVWIQSPKLVIQNLIHAADINKELLGDDRIINLPGLTTSIHEMIKSLEKITNPDVIRLISYEQDAFLQRIVLSWPPHFDTQRANALGFKRDSSAAEIILLYIDEEGIVNINSK